MMVSHRVAAHSFRGIGKVCPICLIVKSFAAKAPRAWPASSRMSHIIGALSVLAEIETLLLGVTADPHADEDLHRLGNGDADEQRPNEHRDEACRLRHELPAHGLAFGVSGAAERGVHEDGREYGTERAADAVNGKNVEGIVDAPALLHQDDGDVADR